MGDWYSALHASGQRRHPLKMMRHRLYHLENAWSGYEVLQSINRSEPVAESFDDGFADLQPVQTKRATTKA